MINFTDSVLPLQHLKDKFWNFIFYKFIFIFGVLNVQTVEEVVMWCLWFAVLVFLHLIVQLCKDRFEYVSHELKLEKYNLHNVTKVCSGDCSALFTSPKQFKWRLLMLESRAKIKMLKELSRWGSVNGMKWQTKIWTRCFFRFITIWLTSTTIWRSELTWNVVCLIPPLM